MLRTFDPNDMFSGMSTGPDQEFLDSITPDVMKCLNNAGFFSRLDDLLCPKDRSIPVEGCRGDYRWSESILRESGFDSQELTEVLDVLGSQGACCDCEVLYNVAESSRLKAQYWQQQAQSGEVRAKHDPSRPG